VAIAALAPKLRLSNVLALDWQKHLDAGLTRITIGQHKTDRLTGRPLVCDVDAQLQRILRDAQQRHGSRGRLVTYRGRAVKSIRGAVMAAAKAAKLTWGRFVEHGITFHTIRHTMATMLAELPDLDGGPALSESTRKTVMAHRHLETTQRYTHIRPTIERRAIERPVEADADRRPRHGAVDARATIKGGIARYRENYRKSSEHAREIMVENPRLRRNRDRRGNGQCAPTNIDQIAMTTTGLRS
jgi:integrase